MDRRGQVQTVLKVLEVRRMQQAAAKVNVALADKTLRELQDRRAAREESLRQDHAQWERAISGASLSLAMAGAWSARMVRGEIDLVEANAAVTRGAEGKALRIGEWRIALSRADAAQILSTKVAARYRRWRDEAAQNELADRISTKAVT